MYPHSNAVEFRLQPVVHRLLKYDYESDDSYLCSKVIVLSDVTVTMISVDYECVTAPSTGLITLNVIML